jgi:ribosomal protein S11
MSNFKTIQPNLQRFFKEIHLKKQYLKKVQSKAHFLNELKEINYKRINSKFLIESKFLSSTTFVMYIIDISFSKKNTLFHVSDCSGNVKFFYSAGSFQQKGKGKVARSIVLRKFYKLLVSKLKFVKKVPLAIHFKNADSNMFWFLKKLKKKFFITIVKHFNQYPYNGCRKRKIRRKKFKTGSLII